MNRTTSNFEKILQTADHNTPFLLLPVRLETHFATGEDGKELRVRIYPSEVHMDYHSERLTEEEILDAKTFWLQWFIASGSEPHEYEAWEKLCAKYPPYRAAWIVRTLKPAGLGNWKPGGAYFYRRPHVKMAAIAESCRQIQELLTHIHPDERRKTDWMSGEYLTEKQIRQYIEKIKEQLFNIDRDIMFNEYVVDYLFDKVSDTLDYLGRRLDSFIAFYDRFPEVYEGNLRQMELWDVDATILRTFRKEVESFVQRFCGKRRTLDEMVQMYLNNPIHDIFPKIEPRTQDMPDFPTAALLPDRFLFIGEQRNGQIIAKEGRRISRNLAVTPVPEALTSRQPFSLDEKSNLKTEGDFSWAMDYDQAVEKGMAITVPIEEDVHAFNYVYVLGLRKNSSKDLAALLNGHIYSAGGLEIIPPGTATNEVDGARGKVHRRNEKEEMRLRYRIEVEEEYSKVSPVDSDAGILAGYLGVDFARSLQHCIHAGSANGRHTHEVYRYLLENWLLKDYDRETVKDRVLNAYIALICDLAGNHMNAAGFLPTLRIGDHPYGILPVADYKRMWKRVKEYGSKEDLVFYDFLLRLADKWHDLRNRQEGTPEQVTARGSQEKYLFMAGQTPYSVRYNCRDMIYNPYLPQYYAHPDHPFLQPFINRGFFTATPAHLPADDGLCAAENAARAEEIFTLAAERFPDIPQDELRIIVSGFLDLFAHRLDAWMQGFLNRAHNRYRSCHNVEMYTGAYGWVFDLEENPRKVLPDSERISREMGVEDDTSVIHTSGSREQAEYIVAPSVQHALTAAVLRSAYLKTRKPNSGSNLCVNLSSTRARQALRMVEGIREGVPTSVILGTDLERSLHEAYRQGAEMDQYIYPLRRMFPQDIRLTAEDPRAGDHLMQVINGETLLNTFLDQWDGTGPGPLKMWLYHNCSKLQWYVELDRATGLGRNEAAQMALFTGIEKMADAYDALNDLLLAEGVHRMSIGDRESFYAVSRFMSDGKGSLPEPAVLDSPGEYVAFTTKAALVLPAIFPMNYCSFSLADSAVDTWLSDFYRWPAVHDVEVRHTDAQGTENVYNLQFHAFCIRPIEHMYLCTNEELLKRLMETQWRRLNNCPDGKVEITLHFNLYMEELREMVLSARPLNGDDLANRHLVESDLESFIDIDDLASRYNQIHAMQERIHLEFESLLHSLPQKGLLPDETILQLYVQLGECARSGLSNALPAYDVRLCTDGLHPVADALEIGQRAALQQTFVKTCAEVDRQFAARLEEARQIVAGITGGALASQQYTDAIRKLTLQNFKVFPRFILERAIPEPERKDLEQVLRSGLCHYRNLGPDAFDDWETEVAEVQEGMRRISHLNMYQTVYGWDPMEVSILQRDSQGDFRSQDWLGVKVSDESKLHDADSLVLYNSRLLRADGNGKIFRGQKERAVCGMVLGSWMEYIPYRKKTASIALHVDQPDNEAPQCLLVALHPYHGVENAGGNWTLEDILQLLDTTRFTVMNRAVEPDTIYKDEQLSRFLPMLSPVPLKQIRSYFHTLAYSSGFEFLSSWKSPFDEACRSEHVIDFIWNETDYEGEDCSSYGAGGYASSGSGSDDILDHIPGGSMLK